MSCRIGQRYVEASLMGSSKNVVQAKVTALHPNATYIHCHSHL